MMKKIQAILLLLISAAVMAVAAVQLNDKLFGYDMTVESQTSSSMSSDSVVTVNADNTFVVHTQHLCAYVTGFHGPTPLDISVKDGVVTDITALPNSETPDFFKDASALLQAYKGKKVDEAIQMNVDIVTGATFSSKALIANMKFGLQKAMEKSAIAGEQSKNESAIFDNSATALKFIIGLLVVLMAAILPLLTKHKAFKIVQLLLNVAVLGFWCGCFLNFSLFIRLLSFGFSGWWELIPVVMLVTAFIYPLFGRKGHYCAHVCPFGSAQELAGKLTQRKWKLSSNSVRWLTLFRRLLFILLVGLMICGIWAEWMDYELFAAFAIVSASVVVIILAFVVLILSIFIPRPYCRFVCPTGTLIRMR